MNHIDILGLLGSIFVGISFIPQTIKTLKSEEIKDAGQYLNNNGFRAKEKLVIVHPFSRDSLRAWGIEKFIGLTKR